MQITIIGAGNMARGIATRALSGGHTVRLINREPDKAARLAAGLQETPQPPTSRQPAQPASAEPASSFSPSPARQPGKSRRSTRLRCPARRSSLPSC
jgi:shikimate 5-dehydrogenase